MTTSPVLHAALDYVARGWNVFPVIGKRPHPKAAPRGLYNATADPLTITRMLTWYPESGVAVRTGAVSTLVVVDLDGPEGAETARELGRRHGGWPATRWAVTGSGGYHAYFRHPGGTVPNTAGRVGPGVDTRGDGGYVVAPPSPHPSGGAYRWWNDRQPADLPAWLGAAMRPPAPRPARGRWDVEATRLDAYAAAALEGERRAVASAQPGSRNTTLNAAAFALGTLVGAGRLDEDVVADVLADAAAACGLPDREAAKTIRSGLQAGAARPRELTS